VTATACAAIIWASYAFFIGRLGGQAFEDKPWIGLLLAFGGRGRDQRGDRGSGGGPGPGAC